MISPDKVRIGMLKIKHLDYNQSNRVHWLDEVRFAGFAQAFTLPVNKRIVMASENRTSRISDMPNTSNSIFSYQANIKKDARIDKISTIFKLFMKKYTEF